MGLICLINWLLAAFFVYLLGRWLRFGRHGALISGLGVFAAGFFPVFLPVRSVAGTIAWFPFMLYAVERSFRQPNWRWRHISLAAGTYLSCDGRPSGACLARSRIRGVLSPVGRLA